MILLMRRKIAQHVIPNHTFLTGQKRQLCICAEFDNRLCKKNNTYISHCKFGETCTCISQSCT